MNSVIDPPRHRFAVSSSAVSLIIDGYLNAMAWVVVESDGELRALNTLASKGWHPAAVARSTADCQRFCEDCAQELVFLLNDPDAEFPAATVGKDFALVRQSTQPDIFLQKYRGVTGRRLHEYATNLPSDAAYVGDDGYLHLELE